MAKGDVDRAAQAASGRVGHHHRHDFGVELQIGRHAVPLVLAQLLQGLIGGGGEVGVAQQSSVGEACTEETSLETAGRGEMERRVKEVREEAEQEKETKDRNVEREVENRMKSEMSQKRRRRGGGEK